MCVCVCVCVCARVYIYIYIYIYIKQRRTKIIYFRRHCAYRVLQAPCNAPNPYSF